MVSMDDDRELFGANQTPLYFLKAPFSFMSHFDGMALHRGKDAEGPPIARYSKSSWLTRGDTEVKMLEGESPRIIKLDRTAILHPSLAMTLRDGTQVEWSVSLFSRSFEVSAPFSVVPCVSERWERQCKTNDQQVIAGLRTSSVNDAEIYVRAVSRRPLRSRG